MLAIGQRQQCRLVSACRDYIRPSGPGIVRITSPEGKLLGTINLPIYGGEPKRQICATNEAFGGPDGKTLFIAACDSVYTIQLKTPGIVPAYNVNK